MFGAVYSLGPQQYPLDYVIGFIPGRFTSDISTLRWLPILWGVAGVLAVYAIGCLFDGRLLGWLWAFLMSTSMLHIQYSLMFRPYSLIVLCSALSVWLFWKACEDRRWLPAYAVVSVLYALVYPFSICKTVVDLVFAHRWRSAHRRRIAQIVLTAWFVFAVMALVHVHGFASGQHFEWGFEQSWSRDVWAGIALQYGQYDAHVVVAYVLLSGAGLILGLRSSAHCRATLYVIAVMVLTTAALLVAVPLSGLFLHARHTLALLPLFLGVTAAPVVAVARAVARRCPERSEFARWILCAVASFCALMTLAWPLKQFDKEIRQTTRVLDGQLQFMRNVLSAGDNVIFSNPNSGATFLYYYDRPAFMRLRGIALAHGVDLFVFPSNLEMSSGHLSNRVYTLCRISAALASASEDLMNRVTQNYSRSGPKTYLVNLPLNYFDVPDPFADVAAGQRRLRVVYPNIYRLETPPAH
jgi:hypothetical protein